MDLVASYEGRKESESTLGSTPPVHKLSDMQELYAIRITASSNRFVGFAEQSMRKNFFITVNGRRLEVSEAISVAAVMMMANEPCRRSVRGEPRAPLCGMGICMECRAVVDGIPHRRTCQLQCAPEMDIVSE